MALTKADLAEGLAETLSMHKQDAKKLVDMVFEQIRTALEQGERVKISGFGNFDLRDKKARPGRNPKTGDAVLIQARRVVTFHAGQKLRDEVQVADEAVVE